MTRTLEEGWQIKKTEFDTSPAKVCVEGWCWPFAVALQQMRPKLKLIWFKGSLGQHSYCTDGTTCFDSQHLVGTPTQELIQSFFERFWYTSYSNPEATVEEFKKMFCAGFPEDRWEETIELIKTWLSQDSRLLVI